MSNHKLAAFKIERRSIAAVLFIETRIDYVQVRTLLADEHRSLASALGFVRWFVETLEVQSAAVERLSSHNRIRRATLTGAVIETLRSAGVSVTEVEKSDLMAAFGLPALKTRKAVREVVTDLWPAFEAERSNEGVRDAAALALYVQVERLLQLTKTSI